MTLRAWVGTKIVGLLVGLILISAAALWGLFGLRGYVRTARDEYKELRMVQLVDHHATAVSARLEAEQADLRAVSDEIGDALRILDDFLAFQLAQTDADLAHQEREWRGAKESQKHLLSALAKLDPETFDQQAALAQVRMVSANLVDLAAEMDMVIKGLPENKLPDLAHVLWLTRPTMFVCRVQL